MRWFRPGLGIKRWFLVVLIGITIVAVGMGVFLLDLYHNESTNPLVIVFLRYTSLLFLPRVLRAFIFGGIGVGIIVCGIWELNRSLLRPFLRPGQTVVDQLTGLSPARTWPACGDHRRRAWTVHVVARLEGTYAQYNGSGHSGG